MLRTDRLTNRRDAPRLCFRHERQMQAQAYCQPIPQQPFMGAGAQHMRPWNGGVPPMGGGGYMPMNMNMNMNMNMQPMGRGRGGMTQGVQRGAMAPQHLRPPNHREGPPPTSMQQQPPHQQSSPQTQTQKPPQEEAAEKFLP